MHMSLSIAWIQAVNHTLVYSRDRSTALVGFSWDAADEKKAKASFDLGRKDFGVFYDVQKIAAQLGYSRHGLGSLCEMILGLDLPKPKHVRPLHLHCATSRALYKTMITHTQQGLMLAHQGCFKFRLHRCFQMVSLLPHPSQDSHVSLGRIVKG